MTSTDTIQVAAWAAGLERSMLRDMIAVVSRPGILSMAGGLPDPALFPREPFADAMASVLATDRLALQYRPPFPPLKTQIARLMATRGAPCEEGAIFVTTGAQQGLNVVARLLLDPGGSVLHEEFVYTGLRQAIAPLRPRSLTVPTDLDGGMDVDAVERHLAAGERPAFIYAIPDAHNPLGATMSLERRERLVALARRYGVPIVEDDPYGLLQYDGAPLPPLRALDPEWVIYLGSFSKILAPALRVGWTVAPTGLLPSLTVIKEACDLESSALTQRAIAGLLESEFLPGHLERLRATYRVRRDVLLGALERELDGAACWSHPCGGMFVWVELQGAIDTAALLERAIERERVAYIPGIAFATDDTPRARRALRLNFTNVNGARLGEGVARLARVLRGEHAAIRLE